MCNDLLITLLVDIFYIYHYNVTFYINFDTQCLHNYLYNTITNMLLSGDYIIITGVIMPLFYFFNHPFEVILSHYRNSRTILITCQSAYVCLQSVGQRATVSYLLKSDIDPRKGKIRLISFFGTVR